MNKELDELLNLMGKIVEITSKNQETLETLTGVMATMVKEHKAIGETKMDELTKNLVKAAERLAKEANESKADGEKPETVESIFKGFLGRFESGATKKISFNEAFNEQNIKEKFGDDTENKVKTKVFLVKQTQYSIDDLCQDDYLRQTIYVCSTREKAEQYAKKLNKEYGDGAVFDDDNLFVEEDCHSDFHHYYDVECMVVDEPLAYL